MERASPTESLRPARTSWPLLAAGAMVLLYVALVFVRPIDGDEGLYLTASDEVARGHQLYRDVAYFQFPLLPYLYAGWMKLVSGPSPAGVRALSVAWDAGTLAAIYLWCRSRKLDDELTTIVLVLFGASGMTVAWASTIKTYPLCNFLSVTSFVALTHARRTSYRAALWPIVAGVALGLATSTRLFYGFCAPFALAWMLYDARARGSLREGLRGALLMSLGLGLGALPTLYFVAVDFRDLWFMTVVIHGLRNRESAAIGRWGQKAQIAFELSCHLQLVALIALGALKLRARTLFDEAHRDELLAGSWVLVLFALQALPTPTFTQYFVDLVPFLAMTAAPGLASLSRWTHARWLLAAYLAYMPFEAWRLEVKPMAGGWGPYTVSGWEEVARAIEARTSPSDRVLAWWPGVVSSAHREPSIGFENNFLYDAASRMTPEMRREYHAHDDDETLAMIRREEPAMVLLRREFFMPDAKLYRPVVEEHYDLALELHDFALYVRKKRGGS